MAWTINYLNNARKKANKISPVDRQRIRKFLEEHLANLDNPRSIGKRLVGKEEIWRYRLGNYRVLCEIQDLEITILVIYMGHRSKIYRQ
jgi:mRNA interferase RelE/StbE